MGKTRSALSECVSARTVLWWLVFTGAALNYIIRMAINIAIIGMVKGQTSKSESTVVGSSCFNVSNISEDDNGTSFTRTTSLVDTDEDKVDWDEYQQNLVLGASFWMYCVTQVPSGMLARRYGTKLVFGLCNYIMCLLGLLIPFATFKSIHLVIAIRVAQGFVGGFVWPALHSVAGAWVPPNERSKFMSSYTGIGFGTALSYFLGGQLIYWYGWRSVFYVTGVLGTAWYAAWCLLMFDSPAKHPRISPEERRYIEERVASSHTEEQIRTPWAAMLRSVPAWLVFLTNFGAAWCLVLMITQAPTYLYFIHGWKLQMAGAISAFPQILCIFCAVGSSYIFDTLLKKNVMSRTCVRKIAIAMCCLFQGLAMLGLAFSGCNSTLAVINMALVVCLQSMETSGQLASIVDLSPNFAGILLGINNSLASLAGIAAPALVGLITQGNQTTSAWQKVFLISAAVVILPDILHLFFGSSELQEWNSTDGKTVEMKQMKEELQRLNTVSEHADDAEKK